MDLSIIVINWNGERYLKNCLSKVFQACREILYEVIVVDNASEDTSLSYLRTQGGKIKLIENSENIGFGKAANQAVAKAKGKYIVIMNPDVEVDKESFRLMISFLESNPQIGIVGPCILNPDGSLQRLGGGASPLSLWASFCHYFFLFAIFKNISFFRGIYISRLPNKPQSVGWVSGACFMIRRETFLRLDGFDEDFFMYSEDVDLCVRAKKRGWQIYYLPQAKVVHYIGGSTRQAWDKIIARQGNNTVRLFRKHRSDKALFFYRLIVSMGFFLRIAIVFLKYVIQQKQETKERIKFLNNCYQMAVR
ncbi:MAG: hypothetical protein B6D56_01400 [Candidatus Omnitrophica bacterium 4484_70.1]|nr:MAG: hypothetical protein B6D56_01400 [Candidatus Omnitrophica bacterium 4484_70.1]